MRLFVEENGSRRPIEAMALPQAKQAAAITDCIGRMIPQEGIDYDLEVIFKGRYNRDVSMNIVPHTDKGAWWMRYVAEMIKKYPPKVSNPEQAVQDVPIEQIEREIKEDNEKVVP